MEDKLKVEAILFSYGDFVEISEIVSLLEISEKKVRVYLNELKSDYNSQNHSFEILLEDSRVKMSIKENFQNLINSFLTKEEIPKKILKTLSIIAYEGPLTKTRLSDILGRVVLEDIEFLYRNKFIDFRKKGIGKYYFVTSKFYDYFKIDKENNLRKMFNEKLNESEIDEKVN